LHMVGQGDVIRAGVLKKRMPLAAWSSWRFGNKLTLIGDRWGTLGYKYRIERPLSEQVADHLRRELTSEEKRLLDLAEALLEHRYEKPKDKLA